MRADPLLSVIVITYNHKDYFEKAIQSVLAQKVTFPMEILIGDDCSTDGTSEIVKRYREMHPEIIIVDIRDENVGAAENAYLLLQKARGKYIASLEGDDYWIDTNKLQRQVDFLEKHLEFIGCTHRIRCIDEKGRTVSRYPRWLKQKRVFSLKDFKGIYLPGQASSLVRRNLFLGAEHDYSALVKIDPMVSDRTAALIYLLQGDFYCFSQVMGVYRRVIGARGENLTAKLFQREDRILQDYRITCRLEKYAEEEFGVTVAFTQFKEELYAKAIGKRLLSSNNNFKNIAKSIREDPHVGWRGIAALPINFAKLAIWHLNRR